MSRVGVWLVGGRGSVATTAVTGAAAVSAGLAEPTGLVTMRPPFTDAGLPGLGELVFGGHDVVETPLAVRAARLVDAILRRLAELGYDDVQERELMRETVTFRPPRWPS